MTESAGAIAQFGSRIASAAGRELSAPVAYAAAEALSAVAQAADVATLEADLAERERFEARRAREATEEAMAWVERVIAAQHHALRERWCSTIPAFIDAIERAESPTAFADAVEAFGAALGFEDLLPFTEDSHIDAFVRDPTATLVFGGAPARGSIPSAHALSRLGPVVQPPVPAELERELLLRTSDPLLISIDPFAGLHASRAIAGTAGIVHHHGVLVGDGTVVHYQGEPDRVKGPIQRTSVSDFLGTSPGALEQHFVRREGREPAPAFAPNICALRALSVVGTRDYSLTSQNCEHLSTWAQTGAMMSGQVDDVFRSEQILAAGKLGPLVALYLAAWTATAASVPLNVALPSAEPGAPLLFDVGRVRWCSDRSSLLWYMPLICSADPERLWEVPFGPHDRPWSFDLQDADAPSYEQPPSIRLSRDWHAALLCDPDWKLFSLERDGTWRRVPIDLRAVVERRIRPIIELNQALAQRVDIFEPAKRGDDPDAPTAGPTLLEPGEPRP